MPKNPYSTLPCKNCRYIGICKRLEDAQYVADKARKLSKTAKTYGFKIDISCPDFEPDDLTISVEEGVESMNPLQKRVLYFLVGQEAMG